MSPPRGGGKSETVGATLGAAGHQGRTQVYGEGETTFDATVMSRVSAQRPPAEKAFRNSIDGEDETAGRAKPAAGHEDSQEVYNTHPREGEVDPPGSEDGDRADQSYRSCSSSAPTVPMTGRQPQWSGPGWPGPHRP